MSHPVPFSHGVATAASPTLGKRQRPTTTSTSNTVCSPPPAKRPATASGKTTSKAETPAPVEFLQEVFMKSEKGKLALDENQGKMFAKPSQECIDAYDLIAVQAVRRGDTDKLRSLLDEGKSLDACNRFGESLIHMACRRGDLKIVKFLVYEARVRLDIRDDFGRTPLHDSCWTSKPNLELMDVLIKAAPIALLLAKDVRGHSPFHYARREHWPEWLQYLRERSDQLLNSLTSIQVVA